MEFVIGARTNRTGANELIAAFRARPLPEGTIYVGYPVLAMGDESEVVDALLISPEHGAVLFDFAPQPAIPTAREAFWEARLLHQDKLVLALKSRLMRVSGLSLRRELAIKVSIVTFLPEGEPGPSNTDAFIVATARTLPSALEECVGNNAAFYRSLSAAIQRVTTIKPTKKRAGASSPTSRGSILKKIEQEIANLDRWQKRAAIECPDGPQRIRGLAGSGKTIVLALKAAYLHTQFPDWTIAVTYQTRSLHEQLIGLIRRFTFEHAGNEPDWTKIRVLPAWGSSSGGGVYSEIARLNGLRPVSFNEAKEQYGRESAFKGICDELVAGLTNNRVPTLLFDAVLIDEAQDLPDSFFRACHLSTTEPKRIVWAYDEMQNLGAYTMQSPEALFGSDSCAYRPIVDTEIGPSWTPRSAIVDTEIGHRGHRDRPSWTPRSADQRIRQAVTRLA